MCFCDFQNNDQLLFLQTWCKKVIKYIFKMNNYTSFVEKGVQLYLNFNKNKVCQKP